MKTPYEGISLQRRKGVHITFQIFFLLQLLFLLLFFINVVLTLMFGWKLKSTWSWQGNIEKALTIFVARIVQQKGTRQNLQKKYCIKFYVNSYVKNIVFKKNLCTILFIAYSLLHKTNTVSNLRERHHNKLVQSFRIKLKSKQFNNWMIFVHLLCVLKVKQLLKYVPCQYREKYIPKTFWGRPMDIPILR